MAEPLNNSSVTQAASAPTIAEQLLAEARTKAAANPAPQPAGGSPTGQALVASPVPPLSIDGSEFKMTVKEFSSDGVASLISVPLPTSGDFEAWSLMQQVVMLKKGAWSKSPISEILWGLAYAKKRGLEIMDGDVYSTGDGRIATSNKAKIKMAMATGRIKGYSTEITDTKQAWASGKCIQKTDLQCVVMLDVEGYNKPIVRKSLLSRWYTEKNPNWVNRPEHMLELNTFAHACEYIAPGMTEPDEAPPNEPVIQLAPSPAPAPAPSPMPTPTPSPMPTSVPQVIEGVPIPAVGEVVPTTKVAEAPTLDATFEPPTKEQFNNVNDLLASLKQDVKQTKVP